MTVIPAQVAGVRAIRVVSPQTRAGSAGGGAMLGVREVYRVGGAQAIAALAYGTESIPRVDKIVGPGNLFVTVAKKVVAFDCAIDFLAGPTEVLIVGDTGTAEFIAADLVAQAEHDPEAMAVFITTEPCAGEKCGSMCRRDVPRECRGARIDTAQRLRSHLEDAAAEFRLGERNCG